MSVGVSDVLESARNKVGVIPIGARQQRRLLQVSGRDGCERTCKMMEVRLEMPLPNLACLVVIPEGGDLQIHIRSICRIDCHPQQVRFDRWHWTQQMLKQQKNGR